MNDGEISFGRFRLDPVRRELRRDGKPVRLGSRARDILCLLASAQGTVVSKDELMERVWPGVVVEENNLQVHIRALRKALEGDDGESWIVTVPGRGYRLLRPQQPPPLADPAPEPSFPLPDKPSLAVLPFVNLSGDPEQEYFADGMVEEITTALSRIRWLFVIARNSSFAYKGQAGDVRRIGRELGVRYLLEGSLRRTGNRIRVTAQLIEAETGKHVWAERYDRDLADIFAVQDEIAQAATIAVAPAIADAEQHRALRKLPGSLDAWAAYQRGLWHLSKGNAEDNTFAEKFFQQAIDLDPSFAGGYKGLALAQGEAANFQGRGLPEALSSAEVLIRRAVALDGADAEALSLLGDAHRRRGDYEGAVGEIERALTMSPNLALAHAMLGATLIFSGRPKEGLKALQTGIRLDPRDPRSGTRLNQMALGFYFSREYEAAIQAATRAIRSYPDLPNPFRWLAAALGQTGRSREAKEALETAISIAPGSFDMYVRGRVPWMRPEDHAHMLEGLRKAGWEARPPADAARELAPTPHHEAERRPVTAMSCELIGVAGRPDGRDLEDRREAVGVFRDRVSEVVHRHGGFVISHLGNTLLILFGYPAAHEDDAEEAVRAGLALRATVRTLKCGPNATTRCRVGIATGMVIVGDATGVGEDRRHEIIGDTPDLAARLRISAQPDTLTIDPTTRRLIGDLFDCRELDAIAAADGSALMRSWQVLGESVVESRFEALRGSVLSPLVGRGEEINLLLRRWARAKAGEGQVVLISGEPGIGKSRMIAELDERLQAEPHLRLRYFCSPHHQDSAFFPFVDQLGHAAGFDPDDMPATRLDKLEALLAHTALPDEDVALLADLMSLPPSERHALPNLSSPRKKERTLEALIRQLEGLALRQPVVGVFEDAHWIDPTSRELLDLMIERARKMPVMLVVTFRAEFQPPWTGQPQVSMLALNRLDRRDRTALVTQVAGGKALPDDGVIQIAEHTDGVPLFVEELTKSVLESGLLREETDRWVLDRPLVLVTIPTTLRASLLARLDRQASLRQEAQIGAAIGRQFSYALLCAVSRLPEKELQAALARLVASELVLQRGMPPEAIYSFKHALVQDAAYDSLLRTAQQQLHAHIAEALEKHFPEIMESQPELLAQHYAEAGLVEKSVACWRKAGDRSTARSAMAEAAAQFQKGLDQLRLLPNTPERLGQELEFWSVLGSVLIAVKGQAASETGHAYARARELWVRLGSPSGFLQIPFGQSSCHMYRGELDLARRIDEDLLRVSRQRNDSAGLVLAHCSSGRNLSLVGSFASSRSHLEEALALYDPVSHRVLARHTGLYPQVVSQGYLGIDLFCLGYPNQAWVKSTAALAEAKRLAHPPSLAASLAIGAGLLALGRDNAVLGEWADQLVALATEQGFPRWGALATIWRGWVKVKNGDVADGISLLRHGSSAFCATEAQTWMPYFRALLARACEIAGQVHEASTMLDDALRMVERTGERWFAAELYRHQGQLLLRQGHTGAAEELYGRALSIAREQEAKLWELRAAVSLARLRRDQGRRTEARDLLAPVYGWFTEGFAMPDLIEARELLEELQPAARSASRELPGSERRRQPTRSST